MNFDDIPELQGDFPRIAESMSQALQQLPPEQAIRHLLRLQYTPPRASGSNYNFTFSFNNVPGFKGGIYI